MDIVEEIIKKMDCSEKMKNTLRKIAVHEHTMFNKDGACVWCTQMIIDTVKEELSGP